MSQRADSRAAGGQRREVWAAAAVVGLMAVGLALRWISLGSRGFWLDEAITVYQASQSIGGIVQSLEGGVHPPLYHLIIHFWMIAFGRSEMAVRSFSVLVGVLSIPAAYWAGRRLYDRPTGLLAAGLVALSPCLIWYSQEARMYAILFLAGMMSTAFLALAVRENRRWLWAGFLFWTLVGMFTHYFFTFLLMGQVAFYLLSVVVPQYRAARGLGLARARWWRPWGLFSDVPTLPGWLSTHVVAGTALLVWLMNSVLSPSSGGKNALVGSVTGSGLGYGQQAATFALRSNEVAAVVVQMTAGFHSQATMDVLVSLWPLTLTVVFLVLHLIRPASKSTVLLLWGSSGIGVMMLIGQWQRQMLVARYFAAVAAPALLLAALLLARIDRRVTTTILAVLLVLWGVAYVDQSYDPHNLMRYDNREAYAEIVSGWQPGDAVFYQPEYTFFLANYYLPAYTHPVGVPVPDSVTDDPRDTPQELNEDLDRLTATANRVWIVLSFQDIEAVNKDGNAVQAWLWHHGYRLAHDDSLDNVEVQRYDAVSSSAPAPAPVEKPAALRPAPTPRAVPVGRTAL